MMETRKPARRTTTFRFLGGVFTFAAGALIIFYFVMKPPMSALGHMALFLATTALISALAGYAAYRFRWMERTPAIQWSLLGGYALASLLTFINVWITAKLMFASQHDLLLATILLLFAGGIAMVLGYFLSSAISERIRHLEQAAKEIQGGDLSARVSVRGNDEVAELAHTFNQMAGQLQEADMNQRRLDGLRRDLVAWAGHDLRTPLTGIRVLVEALADGIIDDPETSKRYLEQARKQIDHLSVLIDDLFQVSQLDAGGIPLNLEVASLSDLISDTLENFSHLADQQGVQLTGSAQPGVDPVCMDTKHIGRAIDNLVSNALHHTPAGGRIVIRAESIGDSVQVTIEDSGEGIAPEDLPHIFDRFYRGEKSRNQATGGSGLGLAIAKGIIEAHEGTIRVESRPNEGAKFCFSLPKKGFTNLPVTFP